MPFYDFVRVTDPKDPEKVAFSVRVGAVPEGLTVLEGEPATRPDGSPLPPGPAPEFKKNNPGQKADPEKETD